MGYLDMLAINEALDGVQVRYQSVTAVQGAAAGLAGMAGILPDLLGLVALNLRATGEIATCCGYDITQGHEREYALYILYAAADIGNMPSIGPTTAVARHHTQNTMEQLAVSSSIRGVARALGTRLVRFKTAQVIPVAGVVAGGGSNALYTARVCETARNLYRERRLQDRYPAHVLSKALEE